MATTGTSYGDPANVGRRRQGLFAYHHDTTNGQAWTAAPSGFVLTVLTEPRAGSLSGRRTLPPRGPNPFVPLPQAGNECTDEHEDTESFYSSEKGQNKTETFPECSIVHNSPPAGHVVKSEESTTTSTVTKSTTGIFSWIWGHNSVTRTETRSVKGGSYFPTSAATGGHAELPCHRRDAPNRSTRYQY